MKNKLIVTSLLLITVTIILSCTIVFSQKKKIKYSNEDSIKPVSYKNLFEQTGEYPHSESTFTEGLFFNNGELYETGGLYGKSTLCKNIDLLSGKAEKTYHFDNSIFAEGSVVLGDNLYVLTYKEHKVYLFDKDTLIKKNEFNYHPDREGWGLTTDGKHLIASDGSSKLYFMDSELNDVKNIVVTLNGKELKNINELEYIDGYIWANVWKKDYIVVIDPNTGNVIKMIDFCDLLDVKKPTESTGVLNGIAYNEKSNKLYITGKNWKKIFEFELIK